MWKIKKKLQNLLSQESGAIVKDPGGKLSVALVYPNTYSTGMGNLAVHSIYKIINARDDMLCERFFLPDAKDSAEYVRSGSEILSMENQRPLSEFDAIAFSISFENDLTNVIPILSLGRIEHRREKRREDAPALIAGGASATINPRALSAIFDSVIPGEFEAYANELPDVILEKGFFPEKRYLENLDEFDCETTIRTARAQFSDMHLIEMQRGCPRGCRFCATPEIYRPFRERSAERIISMINRAFPERNRFGLIGSDILSHPGFVEIADTVHRMGGTISPSSIRADAVTEEMAKILKRSGHKSVALGVEAAKEPLRNTLGKGLSDRKIFTAVENLAKAGISGIRLYFMIGLPGESDEDLAEIPEFARRVRDLIRASQPKAPSAGSVEITISPFVPKPGTHMADMPFVGIKEIKRRIKIAKSSVKGAPWLKVGFDSPENSACEAFLASCGPEAVNFLETAFEAGSLKKAIQKHAPEFL